jgi:hypothetical protein
MTRRTRIILALIGLLLVGISVAALSYAFAPAQIMHASAPLAPTLLAVPPGGGAP